MSTTAIIDRSPRLRELLAAGTIVEYDTREEWLASRQTYLGSDDVAALYGVGYTSEFDVWRRFANPDEGDQDDDGGTSSMFWGKRLETAVLDGIAELEGFDVIPWPQQWRVVVDGLSAACTPDAVGIERRESILLEVKCFSEFAKKHWPDGPEGREMPEKYQVQAQLQLAATGLQRGYFVVMFGTQEHELIEFHRHQPFIDDMIERIQEMDRRVREEDPPEIDGSEATRQSLFTMYPIDDGYAVELDDGTEVTARELEAVKAQIKQLEKDRDKLKNRMIDAIGDASYGVTPGGLTFSLKQQTQQRVDSAKLAGEFSEVYEKCKKVIKFRSLRSVKKLPRDIDFRDPENSEDSA